MRDNDFRPPEAPKPLKRFLNAMVEENHLVIKMYTQPMYTFLLTSDLSEVLFFFDRAAAMQ